MAFWVSFLWSLAFTVVGELLRPKPKPNQPKPSSLGDIRFPTADEARIIPVVYGTCKVTGPNAVWWGDFKAIPITKKVKTGLFSSDRITMGYQYHMGLQLALCWGTVDELIGLQFDDKDVPLLNRVNSADMVTFAMDAPTLFSSDDPKNGLKGSVKFYNGTFNQVANSYLTGQWGVPSSPAYRGVCYAVFENCYLSNNDSIPAIAWVIRRTPNTLGLTGGKHNIAGDANPACAIFEIMTNTFWGAGIPAATIDTASFVAVANTLFDESLGISMLVDSPSTAEDIMGEILRHIDGVVFIDPETGKFSLKLARADYVIASLPLFGPSNIEADSFKYTRGSWDETKNTVKVKYVDRAQAYTERVVQHQNLANISARGGQVDADDFDFIGLSNPTAANIVAARVMKTVSSPLSRVDLQVNRTAFGLRPGSVFRLSWPQLGVVEVVYRVTEIDYGGSDSGVLQIKAVEDVFATSFSSYVNPPTSGWVNPLDANFPLARQSAFEVPFGMIAPDAREYVVVTGSPASGPQRAYTIWEDPAGGTSFTERDGSRTFTPSATLVNPLPSNTAALITTGITLDNPSSLTAVVSATQSEFDAGEVLARIVSAAGEEIVAWRTITDNLNGTYTLNNILRGQYDTVPLSHPAGGVVWFVTDGMGLVSDTPYTSTVSTVALRATPFGVASKLPLASATTMSVTLSDRAGRPYPPGNLRLNSTYMPATITGALTVAWSARNRLTQARLPYSQVGADITAEASTTYTLRLYDETDTLRRTYSGLSVLTQTWDTEIADCGLFGVPVGSPDAEALGIRDNCVYYYPLSETTGTTARDVQITNPINATYSGVNLAQTAIRAGGTTSVRVNSTDRIVSGARPEELLATGTYSMAGWFRFTAWSSTANTLCIALDTGETEVTNYRAYIYVDANRRLALSHEYGAGVDEVVTAAAMTPLALNTSYHISVAVSQANTTDVALLNFNGANGTSTFTDATGRSWTVTGTVTNSTARLRYGTASALFGASGALTTTAANINLPETTGGSAEGTFCIQMWVFITSMGGFQGLFNLAPSGAGHYAFIGGSGLISASGGGIVATTSNPVPTNQWVHLAFVRKTGASANYTIYMDGVAQVTSTMSETYSLSGAFLRLGADTSTVGSTATITGSMDDFSLGIGDPVYTANFTPPTSELALSAPTGTNEVRFYVNGALVDTQPYTNPPTGGSSATARLVIGSGSLTGSSTTVLNGTVQDVLFTTDVLTASEITWLYNGGSGRAVVDVIGSVPRLSNSVRVELESVRSGTVSRNRHNHTVTRTA